MRNDESVKLMAETLKSGLTKFVGSKATRDTMLAVRDQMLSNLKIFCHAAEIVAPLPVVDVMIEGEQATISFRDPKSGENIPLPVWMARASEGFYDRK